MVSRMKIAIIASVVLWSVTAWTAYALLQLYGFPSPTAGMVLALAVLLMLMWITGGLLAVIAWRLADHVERDGAPPGRKEHRPLRAVKDPEPEDWTRGIEGLTFRNDDLFDLAGVADTRGRDTT